MDAVSYAHSAKQAKRIKRFIENPDSNSGVLTQPKVIEAGETVTIKSGRQAILADTVVEGDLVIEAGGDVFVPAGAGFSDLESQIALKADTSYVNGKYSGFKNYIINGGFDIWQRGASISGISAATVYRADRWYFRTSSSGASDLTTTKSYSSAVGTYLTYTYTSSTSGHYFRQHLENPVQFSNKTMTVSIDVYNCSVEASFSLSMLVNNGTSDVLAQGLGVMFTTHTEVLPNGIRYSSTFTVPDLSSYNLTSASSFFSIGFNTNWVGTGSFRFGKVQLEEGSVATPFENRPYGLELSLCQRYLPYRSYLNIFTNHGNGQAVSTTQAYIEIPQKTTARTIPTTLTWSGNMILNAGAVTQIAVTGISLTPASTQTPDRIRIVVTVAGGLTNGGFVSLQNSADATAYIEISTEL